jgi:hypothetical protein
MLLLCVFRYSLSYITFNYYSRWAQVSYRLAFVSAAATYGIVVYKAYRARLRAGAKQQGVLMLASDENVQYLRMASNSFRFLSTLCRNANLTSSHGPHLGMPNTSGLLAF